MDLTHLLVEFQEHVDERGSLIVGEFPRNLPFEVARFFVVTDVPPNVSRGSHSHREHHQLLIAVKGSIRVDLTDGTAPCSIVLDRVGHGLWIPPLFWATEHYLEPTSTLLVLTSHPYDVNDYIDSMAEMLELRANADER